MEAVLAEVAGRDADDLGWIRDVHAEVHRASRIVMQQWGIPLHAALPRSRGYAYVNACRSPLWRHRSRDMT